MIRRSTLIAFEIFVGVLVTLGLGLGLFAWRLSQGPIDLPAIKRDVELRLSEARGGRAVRIDRVELAWSGPERGLELKARNVTALDANGKALTKSEAVGIGLSLRGLLAGRIAVGSAVFDGGEVTVTMARDGSAQVAFGPPGSPADFRVPPPPPNETLTQRVNRILDGLAGALKPIGVGGYLRHAAVERARVTIVDEARDSVWRAQSANISADRNGDAVRFLARADFRGPRGVAPGSLDIATDTTFSKAQATLNARGVQPNALLPESAIGPLGGLRAPMNAAITIGLDRKVGVTLIRGDVSVGRGVLKLGSGEMAVSGGRLRGDYDINSDALSLHDISLNGVRSRIRGRINVRQASSFLGVGSTAPAPFDVSLPALEIEAPGALGAPVALRDVVIKGAIAPQDSAIDISEAHAVIDSARLDLAGRVFWAADAAGKVRPGAKLDGGIAGVLNARSILALWPLDLADGARDWLETGIVGGRLRNVTLRADVKPADVARGALPDQAVSVKFDFDQAQVRYMEGMTVLSDARGSAELKGNRFDLAVQSGRVGTLAVTQGRVEMPRLSPKGAVATFSGRAEGDARAMVDLLRQAPIGLDARFPADPATIVGRGVADFAIKRPMLREVPKGALKFTVDARLDGVGGVSKDARYTIANWRLRATGDERAITLAGPLTLNRSQANLTWTESFNVSGPPSRFVVDGRFDAPDLIRFGFGVAKYARGLVGVQLRGTGRGLDIAAANARLDLRDADIALPGNAWTKRTGRPATVDFEMRETPDGGLQLADLDAKGPGLIATGAVTLTADNRLSTVNLTRLWIDGRTDLRVTGRRSREGVLLIAANGPMFDAAPYLGATRADTPQFQPVVAMTAAEAAERWDTAIQADRIMLRGGAELTNGRVEGTWVGPMMTRLDVRGAGPDAKPVVLSLGGPDGARTGPISFRADDMGFAYRAVTGQDNVRGGAVKGEGVWRADTGRAEITLKATNFQVVKLGPMARLLSSVGSLRGMAEMLNGEGVSFAGLEAPLTILDGRLYVAESRAAGPSLGITAKGTIELDDGTLDLDGVLVPSYGLNSMLSGVPVLGSLLASRPGEGVVGLTYSINGPSDAPRVGVNPLSALTPGILRRIFEPWAAPAIPPATPATPVAPSNG